MHRHGRVEHGNTHSPKKRIATTEKLTTSCVGRVLHRFYLAPDIIEAIVNGRQSVELSAQSLLYRHDLALDWTKQREELGFADR
jgi:hypothetical protein